MPKAARSYIRSLRNLQRWLSQPISFEQARDSIRRRLQTRENSFLRLVRRCVFENARSPYLPMLREAGCEYGDLAQGIRRHGLEGELARLKAAGVWLSLDEFKGRAPITRGSLELRPRAADFDNPIISPIVVGGSGGSTGRPVRSIFDLQLIAVMATYQAFFLKLLGLYDVPLVLWYPQLPAPSGMVHNLMYAKLGQPPRLWFDTEFGPRDWAGWQGRLLTNGLVSVLRGARHPLARYASTEMGVMGVGCRDPQEIGDLHLCHDLVAVVQDDEEGEAEPPLLAMTSLHEASPKVMINVELGDCARVVRRKCGCPLSELGLDVHLLNVHSVGRVTCEGMTVAVADLVSLVETALSPKYGGSPVDYQWAEQEDRHGKGKLILRISPSLGTFQKDQVAENILRSLARRSRTGRMMADTWREAKTLHVVRERPRLTAAGKTLPFVREGRTQSPTDA